MYSLPPPTDSFIVKELLHDLRHNVCPDKRLPFSLVQLVKIVISLKSILKDRYKQTAIKAIFLTAFFGLQWADKIAQSPKDSHNLIFILCTVILNVSDLCEFMYDCTDLLCLLLILM